MRRTRSHLINLREIRDEENILFGLKSLWSEAGYDFSQQQIKIDAVEDLANSWLEYVMAETGRSLFADFLAEIDEARSLLPEQRRVLLSQLEQAIERHLFLSPRQKNELHYLLQKTLEERHV